MLSLGKENFQVEACAIVHSMISAKFLCKTYYWKKKRKKRKSTTPTISKLA